MRRLCSRCINRSFALPDYMLSSPKKKKKKSACFSIFVCAPAPPRSCLCRHRVISLWENEGEEAKLPERQITSSSVTLLKQKSHFASWLHQVHLPPYPTLHSLQCSWTRLQTAAAHSNVPSQKLRGIMQHCVTKFHVRHCECRNVKVITGGDVSAGWGRGGSHCQDWDSSRNIYDVVFRVFPVF